MNRETMTQCMRDGCTYQQLHTIEDNKKLKEEIERRISEFHKSVGVK